MFSLKDEAEVCRIGLIIELLNRYDVVAWSDKVIAAQEYIEDVIADISLNGSKYSLSELEVQLLELKGVSDRELVINILLGICSNKYNNEELSASETSAVLYRLILFDEALCSSSTGQEILHLTDSYDLASNGTYGYIEKASMEIKEFLGQYSDYYYKFICE